MSLPSQRSLKYLVVGLVCLWRLSLAAPIPLEGTKNTRDLGGMPVAGGHLRSGCLYRSGALCYATQADVEKLGGLHLRTVVDLRTDQEIAKEGPDRITLD